MTVRQVLCLHANPGSLPLQALLGRQGIATALSWASDAETLRIACQRPAWDLLLCDWLLYRRFGVAGILAELPWPLDASLILLKTPDTALSPAEGYRLGAQDVVVHGNLDHLAMVCRRELEHTRVRKEARELRRVMIDQAASIQTQHGLALATIRDMSPGKHPGLTLPSTVPDMLPEAPETLGTTAASGSPPAAEDPATPAREGTERALHKRINDLINRGGLTLEFQPIISFKANENQRSMFEALVRLKDETGTLMNPGAFLPVLSEAGWMGRIDLWIFRRALAILEHIQSHGSGDAMFFINIDTQTLRNPELVKAISTFILAAHIAPGSIMVEVRGEALEQTGAVVAQFAKTLRSKQHGLLLEAPNLRDPGFLERHASLLTHVKLDAVVTHGLVENRISIRLLEEYVTRAHHVGIRVISLAVDNADLLPLLFKADVDGIQGHFVSMPHEKLIYPSVQRIEANDTGAWQAKNPVSSSTSPSVGDDGSAINQGVRS